MCAGCGVQVSTGEEGIRQIESEADIVGTDFGVGQTEMPDAQETIPEETETVPPESTEPPTEAPTEAPSEAPTEAPTEAPAEPEPEPAGTESSDWNLILVNPWNKLPEDFSVELKDMGYGHYIDARAYSAWEEMFDAAYAAGVSPVVCSSYRSHDTQTYLYWNKVQEWRDKGYEESEAQRQAGMWVALPDTSEHQLGLALDIVDTDYRGLDWEQENTETQKWLMENSYKYGFILRYPSDKSDITGINYEPWHYRYVGKEVAKEIYELGVCLEEYLEMKNA